MELSVPPAFNTSQERLGLYRRVLQTIQAVPGVEKIGIIGDLFIANSREQVVTVERGDGTVSQRLQFVGDQVSADFFKAIGTPLLRGRFFSRWDGPDAPPVAIVNEAMARRSWAGHNPVGRRFKLGPPDSANAWYTVVGVVGDMRRQGLERDPFPQMFVSLEQSPPPRNVDLFVRTSSAHPITMAKELREAVRRVDKNAPIYGVAPLEQQLGTYLALRRFQTSLLTGLSIVALLMAAIGIYGLIQYSITTRTREIGIRIAMGAQARQVFSMVIAEGLKLSLTGLTVGLLGALWLGQASSTLLYGVAPTDPSTFIGVSLLLIAVAISACCFPARRAIKIEPVAALRRE
jgi:predicted permease